MASLASQYTGKHFIKQALNDDLLRSLQEIESSIGKQMKDRKTDFFKRAQDFASRHRERGCETRVSLTVSTFEKPRLARVYSVPESKLVKTFGSTKATNSPKVIFPVPNRLKFRNTSIVNTELE